MEEVEKNIAVSEEFVVSYFQTPLFVCIYGSLNTLGFTLVSSELESFVWFRQTSNIQTQIPWKQLKTCKLLGSNWCLESVKQINWAFWKVLHTCKLPQQPKPKPGNDHSYIGMTAGSALHTFLTCWKDVQNCVRTGLIQLMTHLWHVENLSTYQKQSSSSRYCCDLNSYWHLAWALFIWYALNILDIFPERKAWKERVQKLVLIRQKKKYVQCPCVSREHEITRDWGKVGEADCIRESKVTLVHIKKLMFHLYSSVCVHLCMYVCLWGRDKGIHTLTHSLFCDIDGSIQAFTGPTRPLTFYPLLMSELVTVSNGFHTPPETHSEGYVCVDTVYVTDLTTL